MELDRLPEPSRARSYNWIVVVLAILAMLGCAYAGIVMHRGSDQPVIDPGVNVSEEPTPAPTDAPKPSATPFVTPESTAEPSAAPSPQKYVKTSIIIDESKVITLSSRQAAEELLRNVEYYFTSLEVIPAGAVTTLLNNVELVSADDDADTTDYDSAFRQLTGSKTPLSYQSVAVFIQDEVLTHDTVTEYTNCLPEGARIVLRYGMDGLRRKTFSSTYINGVRKQMVEIENVTVYPSVEGHILIGTAKYDPRHEPAPSDGRLVPLPDGISFVSPLKGRLIREFGLQEDGFHNGIDIAAESGSSVVAVCRGTVVAIMERGEYGLMIDILHDGGVTSRYSRLGRAFVSIGDVVKAGDIIGTVGFDYSDPHVHFEVRYRCAAYDPMFCFADPGIFDD